MQGICWDKNQQNPHDGPRNHIILWHVSGRFGTKICRQNVRASFAEIYLFIFAKHADENAKKTFSSKSNFDDNFAKIFATIFTIAIFAKIAILAIA